MHHVAIMKKEWGMLQKILNGEKTIESRWYMNRSMPWGRITSGDTVFFKNSGELVTVTARVSRVMSFDSLSPDRVRMILKEYGARDGIDARDSNIYYQLFKDKKYCLLVFISHPIKIKKPFHIDKTGFGSQAAWLAIENIKSIKIPA